MKKISVMAATTAVAAMGSLVLAPAAQADPYPRSVDTQCIAVASDTKVAPREDVRVKFKWTAEGNLSPRGNVNWVIKQNNGRTYDSGSFFLGTARESKTLEFSFPKGKYTVRFRTQVGENSIFRNCSASTDTIKVGPGFGRNR